MCVSGVTAHIKHCEVSILKNGEQGEQRKQEVPLIWWRWWRNSGNLMPLLPYHITEKPGRLPCCLRTHSRNSFTSRSFSPPHFNSFPRFTDFSLTYFIHSPDLPARPEPFFTRYISSTSPTSPVLDCEFTLQRRSDNKSIIYTFRRILSENQQNGPAVPQTMRSHWHLAKRLCVNGRVCPQRWALRPSWRISSAAHAHISFS